MVSRQKTGGTRENAAIGHSALFLIAAGVLAAIGVGSAQVATGRAPDIFFVPTWEPVVYRMLELAGVTKEDVVVDLGSGDGRIVILAAQKYGARGIGVEIDPKLVALSRQVAQEAGVGDRVTFIEGDLFTADLSRATVVTLFLSPSVNNELEPKLRRELKRGTRIVSHQFPIGRWTPDKTLHAAEDKTDLFLWVVR
jgi:SAM-dependent methyltransferase